MLPTFTFRWALRSALVSLVYVLVVACSKPQVGPDPVKPVDPPAPAPTTEPKPVAQPVWRFLSDTSLVAHYEPSTLAQIQSPNDSLVYQPKGMGLSIYRLNYRTQLPDGSTILASGLLYVPTQAGKAYPLLSFQHATAYSEEQAPSGANLTTPSFSYALYFASQGYLLSCPDYIGYGKAHMYPHPYEHRQSLAQATLDMLRASKEFLATKTNLWNNQVFLAGYSEGGYATLATQKMIQEKAASEFNLVSTSCGSGPYATQAFYKYITTQPTLGKLANYLYAWQILSYNEYYHLNKPVSYYFKAPYAEMIRNRPTDAQLITESFHEICTDQFKADVQNPDSEIGKALADNDLTGWVSKTPLHLLHGDQDEYIAYLNTTEVVKSMLSLGATTTQLTRIPNGYHVPTEVIYMRRTLEWFNKLKK